jgi:hypothetical protein
LAEFFCPSSEVCTLSAGGHWINSKAFPPSITRQEARELIYGAVLETALPDAMGAHESAMLN